MPIKRKSQQRNKFSKIFARKIWIPKANREVLAPQRHSITAIQWRKFQKCASRDSNSEPGNIPPRVDNMGMPDFTLKLLAHLFFIVWLKENVSI